MFFSNYIGRVTNMPQLTFKTFMYVCRYVCMYVPERCGFKRMLHQICWIFFWSIPAYIKGLFTLNKNFVHTKFLSSDKKFFRATKIETLQFCIV
jgi:hypothetical protein